MFVLPKRSVESLLSQSKYKEVILQVLSDYKVCTEKQKT